MQTRDYHRWNIKNNKNQGKQEENIVTVFLAPKAVVTVWERGGVNENVPLRLQVLGHFVSSSGAVWGGFRQCRVSGKAPHWGRAWRVPKPCQIPSLFLLPVPAWRRDLLFFCSEQLSCQASPSIRPSIPSANIGQINFSLYKFPWLNRGSSVHNTYKCVSECQRFYSFSVCRCVHTYMNSMCACVYGWQRIILPIVSQPHPHFSLIQCLISLKLAK